jgi:hypothetical protein
MLRSTTRVLASRLGLAPETLSRVMRDLADRGVIRVEGRRIVVPDTRLLATLDEVTGVRIWSLPMFLDRGQGQAARSGVVSQPAERLFRSDGRRC